MFLSLSPPRTQPQNRRQGAGSFRCAISFRMHLYIHDILLNQLLSTWYCQGKMQDGHGRSTKEMGNRSEAFSKHTHKQFQQFEHLRRFKSTVQLFFYLRNKRNIRLFFAQSQDILTEKLGVKAGKKVKFKNRNSQIDPLFPFKFSPCNPLSH